MKGKCVMAVVVIAALLAIVTARPASALSHDQDHLYDDNGNQITEYNQDENGNIKVIKSVEPTSPETAGCNSYDMDTHECNGWYYVPGDDNHKGPGDSHSGDNQNNHKSTEKFKVRILLDDPDGGKGGHYKVRVIVYGIHTLNKPTLDKPGNNVDFSTVNCQTSCYHSAGVWSFTNWKVHNGDSIKACAVDVSTQITTCGYGNAHKWKTDSIVIPLSYPMPR